MKKKLKPKTKVLIGAATALVVVAGGAYLAFGRPTNQKTVADDKKTPTAAEIEKADKLDKPTPKTVTKTTTTTTTGSAASTPTFSLLVNRPVNGDTVMLSEGLQLRTTITGASTGTCSLTLTGPSGQKVTKSANFAPQASYSSCSIDVSGSELAVGSWQLSLVATSGGATSNAINEQVTVQ